MIYFQTILVYTLLTILMSRFAYASQRPTRYAPLLAWIPLILFTLVFGLRYGVGIDYYNYTATYEEVITYDSFSEVLEEFRHEWGFLLITYLCGVFRLPVYVFFSIFAFLQIFLIYEAFKDESDVLPYIYITLIFTGLCIYDFMNIIRNEVAFCIFVYSLKYIKSNQPLRYWIGCFFAYAFHHSAIILFPLYFIWIRKKDLLHYPVIQVLIFIGFIITSFISQWQNLLHFFDNVIILLGYEDYVDIAEYMNVSSKMGFTRLLNIAVNIIIILNSNKIKEYFKSDLFNIIYALYFIGIGLHYFFLGSMMFQRMIVFFYHLEFIVIAYALSYFYHTRKQRSAQWAQYAFIAFFLFMSYTGLIRRCEQNTAAYVSYFQTDWHTTKQNWHEIMMQRY